MENSFSLQNEFFDKSEKTGGKFYIPVTSPSPGGGMAQILCSCPWKAGSASFLEGA